MTSKEARYLAHVDLSEQLTRYIINTIEHLVHNTVDFYSLFTGVDNINTLDYYVRHTHNQNQQ